MDTFSVNDIKAQIDQQCSAEERGLQVEHQRIAHFNELVATEAAAGGGDSTSTIPEELDMRHRTAAARLALARSRHFTVARDRHILPELRRRHASMAAHYAAFAEEADAYRALQRELAGLAAWSHADQPRPLFFEGDDALTGFGFRNWDTRARRALGLAPTMPQAAPPKAAPRLGIAGIIKRVLEAV